MEMVPSGTSGLWIKVVVVPSGLRLTSIAIDSEGKATLAGWLEEVVTAALRDGPLVGEGLVGWLESSVG
jgi:hypothetical protein